MTNTDKTLSTERLEMLQAYPGKATDLDIALMAAELLVSHTQSPAEWHKRLHMTRKALERAEKFAADYEFDSDEGFHVPSDLERMLMLDMLNGLFDDEEFIAALDATPPASERSKEEVGVTDGAEARIKALEEALRPFSEYLDECPFDLDNKGNALPDDTGPGWTYLTAGDFRRARATLNSREKGE